MTRQIIKRKKTDLDVIDAVLNENDTKHSGRQLSIDGNAIVSKP